MLIAKSATWGKCPPCPTFVIIIIVIGVSSHRDGSSHHDDSSCNCMTTFYALKWLCVIRFCTRPWTQRVSYSRATYSATGLSEQLPSVLGTPAISCWPWLGLWQWMGCDTASWLVNGVLDRFNLSRC